MCITILSSRFTMKESNLLYQRLDSCLRPHKDLFNLHTKFFLHVSVKRNSWSIYISFSSFLWTNAVFTSNCTKYKSNVAYVTKITLIFMSRTTRKISHWSQFILSEYIISQSILYDTAQHDYWHHSWASRPICYQWLF